MPFLFILCHDSILPSKEFQKFPSKTIHVTVNVTKSFPSRKSMWRSELQRLSCKKTNFKVGFQKAAQHGNSWDGWSSKNYPTRKSMSQMEFKKLLSATIHETVGVPKVSLQEDQCHRWSSKSFSARQFIRRLEFQKLRKIGVLKFCPPSPVLQGLNINTELSLLSRKFSPLTYHM